MKKLRIILISAMLLSATLLPVSLPARIWEPIRTERNDVKTVTRDSEIEIKATRGVIQITLSRPMQVKVFTILGRQVGTETVAAGTSQLIIRSHGVYIVKVGDIAAKVAV